MWALATLIAPLIVCGVHDVEPRRDVEFLSERYRISEPSPEIKLLANRSSENVFVLKADPNFHQGSVVFKQIDILVGQGEGSDLYRIVALSSLSQGPQKDASRSTEVSDLFVSPKDYEFHAGRRGHLKCWGVAAIAHFKRHSRMSSPLLQTHLYVAYGHIGADLGFADPLGLIGGAIGSCDGFSGSNKCVANIVDARERYADAQYSGEEHAQGPKRHILLGLQIMLGSLLFPLSFLLLRDAVVILDKTRHTVAGFACLLLGGIGCVGGCLFALLSLILLVGYGQPN
jgi:hypothetical protein